jgi:hypothetical protein
MTEGKVKMLQLFIENYFTNPLVTVASFLGRSYLNLQVMWSMVKKEFHFFFFFFKVKNNEDICV